MERFLVRSPLGAIEACLDGDALRRLAFVGHRRLSRPPRSAYARAIARRIEAYFHGDLAALDALPLAPEGTTFQQQVWRALRRIPAGRTRAYGEIAAAIGNPGSGRAVGLACGANPVAIAIPCHRVVGKDGSLTGYASGLARKRWLLAHEGSLPG